MSDDDIREALVGDQGGGRVTPQGPRRGGSSHGGGDGDPSSTDVAKSVKKANKALRKAHVGTACRHWPTGRARRRTVSHRPPATGRGAPSRARRQAAGMWTPSARASRPGQFRGLPGEPQRRPTSAVAAVPHRRRGRKVVGVGSVGTRAFIVLLQGRDNQDPLFLQVKEARARSWRHICPRAATPTPVSGSSRDSD